jgi:hypothetical protein
LLFQDASTFHLAIALCYYQQIVALHNCVPPPSIWVVCEAIIRMLLPIVIKAMDIGYLEMPCNLSFPHVMSFVMNLHIKLSLIVCLI